MKTVIAGMWLLCAAGILQGLYSIGLPQDPVNWIAFIACFLLPVAGTVVILSFERR